MSGFSIVIPTRDWPDHIVDSVKSVLLPDGGLLEVVVVDQSADDETERRLAAEIDDRRLTVVRTSTRGVAAARNVGIAATSGGVILCTDDDCRAPSDWIAAYRTAFEADPEIDVAYSTVVLPDDAPADSFAASFRSAPTVYRGKLPGPHDPWGISANMAIRRSSLDRFGLFDESLGAGGRFGSGAETDLTMRVIANGGVVAHLDGPAVLHLGLRDAPDAGPLVRRYGAGLGAVGMKHLRLRSRPGRLFLL
ncbi:MAG: glycosyltransferase family 2 protein, partial [Ilumatobacteraceae bacterium]